ncbi:hypothetical protein [Shewanella aquimarina]|uniref:hypothetical protein n=1 Tax=Shewanella aquimarina TaxID=260365 RepID=UPI002014EFA0|nr:hypothetical protein [Shewanella aquimarina]MCL2911519.1 hypothetical protein [Shewanella aquimarina]
MEIFISIIAIFIAYITFDTNKKASETSKNGLDLSVYRNHIYDDYVEGKFEPDFELDIDGKKQTSIRQTRNLALDFLEKDQDSWNALSTINSRVNGKYTWQNTISYHIADGLQSLGLLVMSGTIPSNLVLASVSDVIIDDWLISYFWVKSYNKQENVRPMKNSDEKNSTYYHRRHAEWLALLTSLWFDKKWNYPRNLKVKELYFDSVNNSDTRKDRFIQICKEDNYLINERLIKEIRNVININLHHHI